MVHILVMTNYYMFYDELSEVYRDAAHERGAGHGIAEVDFIFLRQEVLTACPEAQDAGGGVGDTGIEQGETFLLLVIADGGVEIVDILQAEGGEPLATAVVHTSTGRQFWGGKDFVLHVEIGRVGFQAPVAVHVTGGLQLEAPVLYLARIHVARLAVHLLSLNHVVTFYIEEVRAVSQGLQIPSNAAQVMMPRQLIVPQTLRL